MATNLLLNQFKKYDKSLGIELPAKDLFVTLNIKNKSGIATKRYRLSDLFVVKSSKSYHNVKDLKDFKNALAKGQLSTSKNKLHTISQPEISAEGVVYEALKIPTITESTTITQTQNGPISVAVPYGYKRAFKVEEAASIDSNKDNYLYLQTTASKNPSFVKKTDIYYYEGLNKVYLRADEKLADLKDKVLYTKEGYLIKELYIEKQYVIGDLIANESFNPTTFSKETYSLEEGKNGSVEIKKSTQKIDSVQVDLKPETVERVNPKDADKTEQVAIFKTRVFTYDDNGEYVKVKFKGNQQETWVKLGDIINPFTVESVGNKNELIELIGYELSVKIGEEELKTEKLTFDQANFTFNTVKNFERNDSVEPMSEDAYILLKSGAFVKENEAVEPICYNVAALNSTTFDAYLAVVKVGDQTTEFVVSKDVVDQSLTDQIEINGTKILKSSLYKLVRANRMANCDVVQTTSKNENIESCKVLGEFNNGRFVKLEAEKKSIELGAIKAKFEKDYASNEYKVEKVFNPKTNKFEEIRSGKYTHTDTFELDDRYEDVFEYRGIKPTQLEYEKIKDYYELKKIGPKFSFKKANQTAFKKWREFFVTGTGVALAAGPFAPLTVSAVWTASIVAIPFIPIVNGIRKLVSGDFHIWKDLSKNQHKKDAKSATKQLEYLAEHTVNKNKKYEDVTKLNFLREYADIRKQILTLSSGQIDADFVMKDFKGDVNVHNARIASQFKRQVENDNGELQKLEEKKNKALKNYNKIKKKYEKAKIPTKKLKKELEKAEIALQEATNNYSSKEISIKMKLESSTTPAEPIKKYGKFDSLLKNADNLKNFVLVKKFTPADEIGLTNDEKNILSKLDFDLTSGKFTYKHKSYSFDKDFTKTTDKNAEIFGVISKINTKMAEVSSITYETENTGIEYTDVIKPVEQQEVISENVQENTAEVVAENELETVNEESSEVETEENLVKPLEVQPQEELHGESQRLRAPSMYSGPFKKSKLEILSSVVSNMEFVAKFVNVSSDTLAKGEKLKKELEDAIFVVTQFSPLLEAFIEKYKGLTVQDKNNVKAVVLDLFARYNKVKDAYHKSVNNFNNVSGNFEV